MKLNEILFGFVAFLTLFTSCKKETLSYENDPRIYFFEMGSNSTTIPVVSKSFSFATAAATKLQDTVFIQVKIMGLADVADRTFTAEAILANTTAIAGTDYKFLPGTVKGNQILGRLPVLIYRTADLKTVTKQLNIKLSDAGDFKGGTIENNKFTLNWNDALIKPDNWDTRPGLITYFGAYSMVKYQFIINTLGMSVFPIQTSVYDPKLLTNAQMLDLKSRLKDALVLYNSSHSTPLTDEFNVVITFP